MNMEFNSDSMSPEKAGPILFHDGVLASPIPLTQSSHGRWRDRPHQTALRELAQAFVDDPSRPNCILGDITMGGGKTLGAPIVYKVLREAEVVDKMCVVVPSLNLVEQYAGDMMDPKSRAGLGHNFCLNQAVNDIDPARGTDGYITTYQAIAQDSGRINQAEFQRARYFLVLDEVHRLKESGSWHRSVEPLFNAATFVLMMSGTLTRGDGSRIAFLPYMEVPSCQSE